jgi:hypothetical protein
MGILDNSRLLKKAGNWEFPGNGNSWKSLRAPSLKARNEPASVSLSLSISPSLYLSLCVALSLALSLLLPLYLSLYLSLYM